MALFYVIAAWLLVQVAETVLPLFDVPDGVLRGLVILLVLAFVPALVLAWVFEPQGLKRETDHDLGKTAMVRAMHIRCWWTRSFPSGRFASGC